MWIVKLGGSLHDAPALRRWLRRLAAGPGPARVIVPGGGPFADTVRRLQPTLGFNELAAHRMAILAMQQLGLALHSIEPGLALAETEVELRAARAAIWLPWQLAGGADDLPVGWEVTSDSLACWLATRLGADCLILVKSAPVPPGGHEAASLVAAGLLDTAFASMARRYRGRILLLHRDADPNLPLGRHPGACRVAV